MDYHTLVLGGLRWLDEVGGRCARSLALRLESIEDLDDRIAVFRQRLLRHLHVHLGAMFLQTQLGVLLEPPGRDLTLAYSTQYRQRRRVVARVTGTLLSEACQVVGKHFRANAQRLDDHLRQIDGHFAQD